MPTFKLNKLVRDKLIAEYGKDGQLVKCRKLAVNEHKKELIRKIIEETTEIDVNETPDKLISEIADIQQSLDDFMAICGIGQKQVLAKKQEKYDKKGGFKGGNFVDTIKLSDDDQWVNYYRKKPNIFPEISDKK